VTWGRIAQVHEPRPAIVGIDTFARTVTFECRAGFIRMRSVPRSTLTSNWLALMASKFWGSLLAGTVLLGVSACGKAVPAEDPPVCGNARLPEVSNLWQCGPTFDFTPINSYQGEFADIQDREDAVVLIDGRCTGTLIEASAGPVVMTAGHCVGLGDRALLVFNFENEPDGDRLVTKGTVIEQALEPDYALIGLDVLPAVKPVLLTAQASERLTIIQHPRAGPRSSPKADIWMHAISLSTMRTWTPWWEDPALACSTVKAT
jgi:hypothetical protein